MGKEIPGSKEYYLIYAELITAARYRGTVTYQEIADLIGLHTFGANMGQQIGRYAYAVSTEEHSHGRPMLSALIVKVGGRPSSGFYDLARQLGKLQGSSSEEEEAFFLKERQAIYATWTRTFEPPQHNTNATHSS